MSADVAARLEKRTGRTPLLTRQRMAAFSAALVVLAWVLMSFGAFVRVSESGLGCPDWPACHGQLVAGGWHAMVEEVHRWIAGILSVGVVGIAVVVAVRWRDDRRLGVVVAAMLGALALQVILGGVTVLLGNVSWSVVIHFGAAALLVTTLVFVCIRLLLPASGVRHDALAGRASAFAAFTWGLLLAGSLVANTDSHTACGTQLPLCNGSLLPALDHHVVINLLHRTWAVTAFVWALWIFRGVRRGGEVTPPAVRRATAAVVVAFCLQMIAGLVVILAGENGVFEVLHSSLASLTWAAVSVLLAVALTAGSRAAVPFTPSP